MCTKIEILLSIRNYLIDIEIFKKFPKHFEINFHLMQFFESPGSTGFALFQRSPAFPNQEGELLRSVQCLN